jgi:ankyrin repeat protein
MFRTKILVLIGIVLIATVYSTVPNFGFSGDTRVADAAMKNDLEGVRALLKQAADANSSQGDGMTALHWAALNGNAEMAQLLIYAGATVKATTRIAGYTPLYLAAQYGNAKVIDVLLKAGADAKAPALGGITPLMMAASSGDSDTIKALLEYSADVNAKETSNGQTAVDFAAAFDRPEAIRILARYGADLNHKSNVINRVYNEITDRNAPPPANAQTGGRGQRGQAAPPAPGQRGAQQAAAAAPPLPVQPQAGQPPQPGQPVAGQGQVPQGAGQGRGNAPRDPTRAGGNPKGQLTPLMYAARQGNMSAASALVDSGAKLNEQSADGSTALLLAAINGHFDLAKMLVERGADVNIASVDGATPLYGVINMQWARKTLHPQPTTKYEKTFYLDLVKLILDKGADPNARLKKDLWYDGFGFSLDSTNATGATAFWKCADVADVEGMKLLVSRGADPNVKNLDNVTPLLVASGAGYHGNDDIVSPQGRMAAVRYLVDDLHADVNAVDGREGMTAYDPDAAPVIQTTGNQQGNGNNGGQQPVPQMMIGRNPGGGYSALHNAAQRGDNEMILFLVSRGARLDVVAKNGNTIVDMANGPRQRVQPFAETIALLEALGVKNNYKCVSC